MAKTKEPIDGDMLRDWASKVERRLAAIEEKLEIDPFAVNFSKETKDKIVQSKSEPEETINGFTKEQLRIMFSWAKSTKLQLLSKGDFEELKRWNMLKDFYPDAPDKFEDIIM